MNLPMKLRWTLLAALSLTLIHCTQLASSRFDHSTTMGSSASLTLQSLPGNDKIDTLQYFLSKNTGMGLTGTHPMTQTIVGNEAWYVKWQSDVFEYYTWDDENIYLKEDHSLTPNPAYSFNSGIWMKRYMAVGEQINASANLITLFDKSCNKTAQNTFGYTMTLEAHDPAYNVGGDVGVQDVIVLRYTYSGGANFEKFYYSSQFGWVRWEWYKAGSDQPIQIALFNRKTNAMRPAAALGCARIGTAAVPGDMSIGAPSVPPVSGMTTAAGAGTGTSTLSSAGSSTSTNALASVTPQNCTTPNCLFYSNLYRKLFNREPDLSGFRFWLAQAQSGSVGCAESAIYFLNTAEFQSRIQPLLPAQIPDVLYTGLLNRNAEAQAVINFQNYYISGAMTKSDLALSILRSPEFDSLCRQSYGFPAGAGSTQGLQRF